MKVLLIGPSETKTRGGMAQVIRQIRESPILNREYEIHSFPSCMDGRLPLRLIYSCCAFLRFLLCFWKYDLFHIHAAERGSTFRKIFYLRVIKAAGKSVILHIHGAEYLTFYDGLKGRKKRAADELFRRADLVLALSESWKRELESRFAMKECKVVYNGVDPGQYQTAGDPVRHRDAFLMMGRLGERKGVYDLIAAMELALEKNPGLTLCLAGDGQVEKVRGLVAERGLEGHITVPGWIQEAEKKEYLKNAGTIVLPSYHEGLPLSILEGMAAGRAVIGTTVGAIPEVVGKENGILVEPGDVRGLAEALLTCSGNEALLGEMSRRNKERAEQVFNIRRMHEKLSECYKSTRDREEGTK